MIGTGKYDFPGIRKAGAAALRLALASTSFGAAIVASPLRKVIDLFAEWAVEWLTNRGLVIFNVGAIYVHGEFDQKAFDQAIEKGLEDAKAPGLSAAQKKAIDDEVIKAFRRFGRVANPN